MKGRIFNSTLYLLLAYYICHILYIGSQYLILKLLDFKELKLFFFYNTYTGMEDTWWTRVKVYLVCGIGIASIFLLLFVVFIYFLKLSRKKHRLNTFYNWLIIVCFGFIITEFFSPSFFTEYTNMYYILRWTRFEHLGGGMYLISIFSLLLIPLVSYFTNKPFIKMTNTTKNIRTKTSRLLFYLKNTLIPFIFLFVILGVLVNLSYAYDKEYYLSREAVRLGIIGLIIIIGAIFSFNKKYISIQKTNTSHQINIPLSLFLIVSMVAYFFILNLNH